MPIPNVTDLPTSAAPDGTGGAEAMNNYKQAQYIEVWLSGPKGHEFVPGITMIQMTETYTGAEFVQISGTFRQERKLGQRIFKGAWTRFQPRLRPLKGLIAACYGIPYNNGTDIRLDSRPVTVDIRYTLFGPQFDYTQNSLDQETVTYAEVFFDNLKNGFIDDPNNFSSEDVDMECQNEQWNGGVGGVNQLMLVTLPYSSVYALQGGSTNNNSGGANLGRAAISNATSQF